MLKCICCKKELDNFMDGEGHQPMNGLSFTTFGHYGSGYFDPMNESFISIAVCDDCVRDADENGLVFRPSVTSEEFEG